MRLIFHKVYSHCLDSTKALHHFDLWLWLMSSSWQLWPGHSSGSPAMFTNPSGSWCHPAASIPSSHQGHKCMCNVGPPSLDFRKTSRKCTITSIFPTGYLLAVRYYWYVNFLGWYFGTSGVGASVIIHSRVPQTGLCVLSLENVSIVGCGT